MKFAAIAPAAIPQSTKPEMLILSPNINLLRCVWLSAAVLLGVGATRVWSESSSRFEFRMPHPTVYMVSSSPAVQNASSNDSGWVTAQVEPGRGPVVQFGRHIVLQLEHPDQLASLIAGRRLRLWQSASPNVFILEAPDTGTALREAQELGRQPGVLASYPVMRRRYTLLGAYARKPNDPYYSNQWNLENRDANGTSLGVDLNVRAAWPYSQGEGVVIAIVDNGVELAHPELAPRAASDLHFSFVSGQTNGGPSSYDSDQSAHGTAVAGLAVAEGNNFRGIIGVAPKSQFASWVIFDDAGFIVAETNTAAMFQYATNAIWVQNHSWGNGGPSTLAPTLLEEVGISNAITSGRNGLGVVMVRGGGNGRVSGLNANDDGFVADPRVIGVGAVRSDGRVASYSSPGACLLSAAPSDDLDEGFPTLFTTDLLGTNGYNTGVYTNDLADYAYSQNGFTGTSGSAPQISGLAALILSARPDLSYRDVQQILLFSCRQWDSADPDLTTNGAGFQVSHNTGFGVPNAGTALRLAQNWKLRPPLTKWTLTSSAVLPIPDAGLRVWLSGPGIPTTLTSVVVLSGAGPHPDSPTAVVPLVDVGQATNAIGSDLTGKAALIQRGGDTFEAKINRAADAGAAFVIIYDNADHNMLEQMGGTDFTRIPAVFMTQDDGEALKALLLAQTNVQAQLRLDSAQYQFTVTNTLLLEQVAVRLAVSHPNRGDLRVTLRSPQGTRSILEQYNTDASPAPAEWTYVSTHHFYESSVGAWTINVSDEYPGNTGAVQNVELVLTGVPIVDSDADGLDDDWEMSHFHTLAYGPQDDPDGDGYNNAQEQILGTDPMVNETLLRLDLSLWNDRLARLSWPGLPSKTYEVWQESALGARPLLLTNVPGVFPETLLSTPFTNAPQQYFFLKQHP